MEIWVLTCSHSYEDVYCVVGAYHSEADAQAALEKSIGKTFLFYAAARDDLRIEESTLHPTTLT